MPLKSRICLTWLRIRDTAVVASSISSKAGVGSQPKWCDGVASRWRRSHRWLEDGSRSHHTSAFGYFSTRGGHYVAAALMADELGACMPSRADHHLRRSRSGVARLDGQERASRQRGGSCLGRSNHLAMVEFLCSLPRRDRSFRSATGGTCLDGSQQPDSAVVGILKWRYRRCGSSLLEAPALAYISEVK